LLGHYPGIEVVFSVGCRAEFVAAEVDPDVAVLDLYLDGDGPSIDVVAELAARYRVLVMSASGRPGDVVAAMRAGANGYLSKRADAAAFLDGITRRSDTTFYLSSQLADIVHADLAAQPAGEAAIRLSPRERQVLR
jgi:DNA-binding NarL/FixJ family response regulator